MEANKKWRGAVKRLISIGLLLAALASPVQVSFAPEPVRAGAGDAWWNAAWPYRVPVTVSGSGIAQAGVNFTQAFNSLGLNHALLDVRSIRVVPYTGAAPGAPIPYAETYSTMLEDADNPQIGWSATGVYWTVNDGSAEADHSRFSQGSGSLKATVENLPGGYGYPGVELHIADGDVLANWSPYEVLVYDVWPEVNASALDQAPDLYWFKLYNACGGSPVTQGGPPLALDRWNYASVSLNPLDRCWPADGLNLANITRMEFHTRDNIDGDAPGKNGWWDDGDILRLWFDNMRLVDQDQGAIRWQTQTGVTQYYIYFDVLTHEGHPQSTLDDSLGAATLTGAVGSPEAGGYYHQIAGASGVGATQVWTAPTIEKVLRTMSAPVTSAPLRMAAARGEFEPFQVIVRSSTAQNVAVSVSQFTQGSHTIPAPTLHRVDYVNITTAGDHLDRLGPWPDPLWPLNNGDTTSFPANENQPLWLTVQVPWDAAPGIYQATVTIGSVGVPVELQVWNFSLPRQIHLASEWGFAWSHIVEDVYKGLGNWPCYWQMVDAFKQDFINHRLIPKSVAWPAGLNYPGGITYDCNGHLDPGAPSDEWEFTHLGGKYIHGEDGFNAGYGFPVFLSHGPYDNYPPDSLPPSFCGVSRSGVLGSTEFQAKWKQYLGAVDAYIVSAHYDDAAYYHIVNEPQTDEDYDIVGRISALTESAAPHLRQLVSEQVEPEIYAYPGAKIDIWMPTISNYEPVKSHDRQKNHGEEVWWYYLYGDDPPLPNPILMSHPGIEARITPWLAWAERVDGLLHYDTTDWSPNPWTTPNVTGKDNGDGFFFYPPRKDGSALDSCGQNGHRLVPSIRWENLRDGMEDYEYLWLLGGDPQVDVTNAADAYVTPLVKSRTLFSRVPTDLEAARAAVAAALGGPTASKSAQPAAVTPGGALNYVLAYTHSGAEATLVVTDVVPSLTTVVTATGPGTVAVSGQAVTWRVPVVTGQSVSLTIQAAAGSLSGSAVNTATFSSTQRLTRSAEVLVYAARVFLPLVLKPSSS